MADELYRPGFSFDNPAVTRIAAPIRTRPWFYQDTAVGPLTRVSKDAPFWKDRAFHPYPAVWNRANKARNVEKLGAYFREVPSIHELGDAAPATSETDTVSRDPISGFLSNLNTVVGAIGQAGSGVLTQLQQQQQVKQQSALAQLKYYTQNLQTGAGGWLLAIAGLAAVGGIGYYMWRK